MKVKRYVPEIFKMPNKVDSDTALLQYLFIGKVQHKSGAASEPSLSGLVLDAI